MNSEKEKLINSINDEKIFDIVQNYLDLYPYDTDIIVLKAYILFLNKSFQEAYDLLTRIIDYTPFDVDAFFTMGVVLYALGKNYEAFRCLRRADIMANYYSETNLIFSKDVARDILEQLMDIIIDTAEKGSNVGLLKLMQYNENNGWAVMGDHVRGSGPIQGEFLYFENDVKYCGYYDGMTSSLCSDRGVSNLFTAKGEIVSAQPLNSIQIKCDGCKSVIPIASEKTDTTINFYHGNKLFKTVIQQENKRFSYFTIDQDTIVSSDNRIIVGNPIKQICEGNRKKLVICLFVDGLSQKAICESGLQNVMPKTYDFFSKGMICNNAYTTSDWTYPSIASCCTGYYASNHMMIHPTINTSIRYKTIFESFSDAGYHTTLINGDWRMDDYYGYLKGVDRCIVKHQNFDMNTANVIEIAIDNIEAFSETDHFLWLSTGDLHSICDEVDPDTSIQLKTSLEEWPEYTNSENSVRQEYSNSKKRLYYLVAKQIDRRLNYLYDFLEENYQDEDYSIVLFGDHGHAYFIPENEHHMSDWLTNVAFMSRGSYVGESNDFFSLKDMGRILFSLSGINVEDLSEGNLPVCYGGEKNEDYVISENIHPNEPVRISLHGKDFFAYFTTSNSVDDHCRVESGKYELKIYSNSGIEITDRNIYEKCESTIINRLKYILSY